MTQSVVVQVGQCGNQIGCRFWDLALREHAAVNHKGLYDEPISTFFRNVVSGLLHVPDIMYPVRCALVCIVIITVYAGQTLS